jgi:hypothetical protein
VAITLVGTPTTGSATNGGNITLTLPTGRQQGDVVYVGFALASAIGGGTSSGGWTQLGTTLDNTIRLQMFRKVMGASPDANIVLTGGAQAADSSSAIAIAFRGVDPTTQEDVTRTTATGSSTNPNCPTITPATTGAVAIAYAATRIIDTTGTGGPAGYSNFTQVSSNDNNDTTSYMAWKGSLTASVAEDPAAFTGISTALWGAFTVAVRPAPEIRTGTLAATDPVDTASFAGDVIVQGSLSVSEGTQDTASFAGDVIVSGSFALSEGAADTASFSGTVSSNEVSGSLAATDVPDTASVAGTVLVSGTLAATDVADVAAFTGTVADPPVTGSFALTDAPDLAAIVGVVASQLSEDTDLAFFTGTVADLVVSMGEAIVSIAAISATNLPTPQELAGDIDAIKPAGFRNEYYPTDAIHLRDQGEPIVEGMNLSFKNGLPVIYVRSGEKILRHIRKPDGSYKTTVHIRKRFR